MVLVISAPITYPIQSQFTLMGHLNQCPFIYSILFNNNLPRGASIMAVMRRSQSSLVIVRRPLCHQPSRPPSIPFSTAPSPLCHQPSRLPSIILALPFVSLCRSLFSTPHLAAAPPSNDSSRLPSIPLSAAPSQPHSCATVSLALALARCA